jgi:hypothetical protein
LAPEEREKDRCRAEIEDVLRFLDVDHEHDAIALLDILATDAVVLTLMSINDVFPGVFGVTA